MSTSTKTTPTKTKLKKARMELWLTYDSEDGYVWSKVYTEFPAHLAGEGAKANHPVKAIRFMSDVYTYKNSRRRTSGGFGKEIPA